MNCKSESGRFYNPENPDVHVFYKEIRQSWVFGGHLGNYLDRKSDPEDEFYIPENTNILVSHKEIRQSWGFDSPFGKIPDQIIF